MCANKPRINIPIDVGQAGQSRVRLETQDQDPDSTVQDSSGPVMKAIDNRCHRGVSTRRGAVSCVNAVDGGVDGRMQRQRRGFTRHSIPDGHIASRLTTPRGKQR